MNAREQLEAVPPLNWPVCTDEAAHSAGLDIAPTPMELTAMAEAVVSAWGDRGHDPLNLAESVADAGSQLARAVPLVLAEVDRLRKRVAELEAMMPAATKLSYRGPVTCGAARGPGPSS